MLKPTIVVLLALAVTAAAPQVAQAGDWQVRVGYGRHGGQRGVHVDVAKSHGHRRAIVHRVNRPVPARHVAVRAPTRRVHVHHHGDHCRFVEGHYDFRMRPVFEPGYHKTVVRPAVYETRYHPRTGCPRQVLIKPETTERVWVPGRTVDRRVRVWVRAHWKCVHHR